MKYWHYWEGIVTSVMRKSIESKWGFFGWLFFFLWGGRGSGVYDDSIVPASYCRKFWESSIASAAVERKKCTSRNKGSL